MAAQRPFSLIEVPAAEAAELRFVGELDAAAAHAAHEALSGAVGRGSGDVVVDLSALTFIDSMGLGTLVKAASRLERQERRLRVVGVREDVLRSIEIMGFRELLGVGR